MSRPGEISQLRNGAGGAESCRLFTERLQQRTDGSACRIGDQRAQSVGADFDAGTTAVDEDRLPNRNRGQSDRCVPIEDENPGLPFRQQRPARFLRKIQSFKNEMPARDENRPFSR